MATTTGQITITDLNDGYTLVIAGGNRAFSYASTGTTPSPSTSGTFSFTLYRGGISLTPTAFSWTATGVFSGTSATATFQPTLNNTYSVDTPTTVTLQVTHEGNTITATQAILVSQAPSNAIIHTLYVSAPAIYKDAVDAATTGTYTSITIQGKKYDGSTNTNFGWVTTTPNNGTESARTDTATTALTLSPTNTSGVSSYTIKLYDAATSGNLLTSQTIGVTFKGATGTAGTNGTSAVLYELGLSAPVLSRSVTSTLTPATIAVSGFSTVGLSKAAYSGRFKIYEDGVLKYTSTANQTSHTYTPSTSAVNILKFELYVAGGTTILLDTQEVPVVVDGSSAMTFSVTNSTYPIPANTSGAVTTYTGSGTTIKVLEGSEVYAYVTTLDTTAKRFTVGTPTLSVANAITVGAISGNNTTTATVAQHSAMSNTVDSVVISYPITYIRLNGSTGIQTVTQAITKVKAGSIGIRGSRQLYSTDVAYVSGYDFDGAGTIAAGAASYAAKATALIAAATAGSNPTTPINGDTVTFSNGLDYVYTITHNGTDWAAPGTIIDGSLLVTGSVTAAKINSNGLEVRAPDGTVILSTDVELAETYIADAAITNAKIGNYISSSDFDGTINASGNITDTGTTGWAIAKGNGVSGTAVFQNIVARGDIEVPQASINSAKISELAVDGLKIRGGAVTFTAIQELETTWPSTALAERQIAYIDFSTAAQDGALLKLILQRNIGVTALEQLGNSKLQVSVDGVTWSTLIQTNSSSYTTTGDEGAGGGTVIVPATLPIISGLPVRLAPTTYGAPPRSTYYWGISNRTRAMLTELAVWPATSTGGTVTMQFVFLIPEAGTYKLYYCADDIVNSGNFGTPQSGTANLSYYANAADPNVLTYTTNGPNQIATLNVTCTDTGGAEGFAAYFVKTTDDIPNSTFQSLWTVRRPNYTTNIYKYVRVLATRLNSTTNPNIAAWLGVEIIRK